MDFGALIGKPILVDLDSLSVLGPVRLKIWAVDPTCVRGCVDVFPAADGFRLRVRVESAAPSPSPPPPPPSNNLGAEDGNAGNMSEGSMPRFTTSEWEGMGSVSRDLFKDSAPKAKDGGKDQMDADVDIQAPTQEAPIAPPPAGTPVSGVCSNLPGRPGSRRSRGLKIFLPPRAALLRAPCPSANLRSASSLLAAGPLLGPSCRLRACVVASRVIWGPWRAMLLWRRLALP